MGLALRLPTRGTADPVDVLEVEREGQASADANPVGASPDGQAFHCMDDDPIPGFRSECLAEAVALVDPSPGVPVSAAASEGEFDTLVSADSTGVAVDVLGPAGAASLVNDPGVSDSRATASGLSRFRIRLRANDPVVADLVGRVISERERFKGDPRSTLTPVGAFRIDLNGQLFASGSRLDASNDGQSEFLDVVRQIDLAPGDELDLWFRADANALSVENAAVEGFAAFSLLVFVPEPQTKVGALVTLLSLALVRCVGHPRRPTAV